MSPRFTPGYVDANRRIAVLRIRIDAGQVVGSYVDATHTLCSFLLDLATGLYTTLNVTAAPFGNSVEAINDSGQLAGVYSDGTMMHGFIATTVTTAMPEPTSLALLGAGLLALTGTRRRRAL